jgi:parallel beta-helix repeat protein
LITSHRTTIANTSWRWLSRGFPVVFLILLMVPSCAPLTGRISGPDHDAVRAVLAGKRTMANAAWWGFDAEDATACLQAAIRSGAKKVIVPDMGRPWVVGPITLESGQEVILKRGVVILARKGAFRQTNDCLFKAIDKHDITLKGHGAQLSMRQQDYRNQPYAAGEWRHGISLLGCRNITISGLQISNSGGDGIYIGRGQESTYCDQVHIKDVVCSDNFRNGISIVSAQNLLIEHCVVRNTRGTPPEIGIDFEPDHADERLVNCRVNGSTIEHNANWGIGIYLSKLTDDSAPISITIDSCHVSNNQKGALYVVGTCSDYGPLGFVQFKDTILDGQQKIRKPLYGITISYE